MLLFTFLLTHLIGKDELLIMGKDFDVQFEGPLRPADLGEGSYPTFLVTNITLTFCQISTLPSGGAQNKLNFTARWEKLPPLAHHPQRAKVGSTSQVRMTMGCLESPGEAMEPFSLYPLSTRKNLARGMPCVGFDSIRPILRPICRPPKLRLDWKGYWHGGLLED